MSEQSPTLDPAIVSRLKRDSNGLLPLSFNSLIPVKFSWWAG